MIAKRCMKLVSFIAALVVVVASGCEKSRTPSAPNAHAHEAPIWKQQYAAAPPVSSRAGADGIVEWRYWPNLNGRPKDVPPDGSTIAGRLKIIECWQDIGEDMVWSSEFERISVGMSYEEVNRLVGEVTLPEYTFGPDSYF